ncbi:MAG: NAD(P)H-binding protein [Microbacteriaceae bacterium]|nr:NAD(P)H-binding protein [Microbacteriaceae bacterium]
MARITVLGAAGKSGALIVAEAARRGHEVTAVVRDAGSAPAFPAGVRVTAGDATDPADAARLVAGQDVVVSAVGGTDPELYTRVALAVTAALRAQGAGRVIHHGGGATLLNEDGVAFLDAPGFPEEFRPYALAQQRALETYRRIEDVDWVYVSPPPVDYAPGIRTGSYRLGTDRPVIGADGRARISYEDLAVAVVDEIERPAHHRERITVGY